MSTEKTEAGWRGETAGESSHLSRALAGNAVPLVSVVIPAYQCAGFIVQAVESVLAQSYTDYEILVVNDGSPDTAELESALRPYQDRIRYLQQENRGPASARNRGILESCGKYVAFLDADDYWGPDHLAKQMTQFQRDPSLDLAYCDCLLIKDEKPAGRAFGMQPQAHNVSFDSLLVEDCAIGTSTAVVSREAIIRAGWFDENFLRCEDFEMWLRLAFSGARMAYHSDADVFHRINRSGLSADRWSMKKDRIRVYQKVAANLPVSTEQKEKVHRLVSQIETDCDIELLKYYIDRGEYDQAMAATARANLNRAGWKVRIAALGLRFAPRIFRQLFRTRMRMLRAQG